MAQQFRSLSIHLASTVAPQRLMLHSREHLVAPAVLLVVGVLNGLYVDSEALVPSQWDGVPVVVNHPSGVDGQPVSAREPAVLDASGLGALYHARLGTGRRGTQTVPSLCAELWLDIGKAEALGGEALQAMRMIEAQEPTEISTGFFATTTATPGTFAGARYTEVCTAMHPDHLALLPNHIGACSVADGCGVPRLNATNCGCATCEERAAMTPEPLTRFQRLMAMFRLVRTPQGEDTLVVAQTDTDTREALYGALCREQQAAWTERGMPGECTYTSIFIDSLDVPAQTFTYRDGERLKQRSWTLEEGVITLAPGETDVQRSTAYLPVTTPEPEPEEEPTTMATDPKLIRVSALITDTNTGWSEDDRPMLEAMTEAALIRLQAQPRQPVAMVSRTPETVEDAIATMPDHLREPMAAMAQEYQRRKAAAMNLLMANKQCPFTADELQAMTAQRLEQLVTMAGMEAPLPQDQGGAYLGRGLPYLRPVAEEDEPPAPPNTFSLVVAKQRERAGLPATN